jgi:tRNA A-37 threonylcarbamoyl transferase component Bud32
VDGVRGWDGVLLMTAERVLGGRYRLVERLGQGGMSVVWRSYDEVLDRQVAVKVLTARYAAHDLSTDRIRAEAQAAARLSHPHVTAVHDYGESVAETGERVPYVVMELLSGRTLADSLRQDGPLPVPVALLTCAQVAGAVAAAHASGLVHRDIKPSNVMLTPAGVKVLDFGLAAEAGTTVDGDVIGTPAYLAPERLTTGEAEPATDVYGLGLLLFAALTGRLPWRVETAAEMLTAHQYVEPARMPAIIGLPRGVRSLYGRCLAKDPARRPTADQVATELAEAALRRRAGRPWAALAAVGSGPLVDGVIETPVVRGVVALAAAAPEFPDPAPASPSPADTDVLADDAAAAPVVVDSPAPGETAVDDDGTAQADVDGAAAAAPPPDAPPVGVDSAGGNRWGAAAVAGAAVVVAAALVGGFMAPAAEPILPGVPAPNVAAPEPDAPPADTDDTDPATDDTVPTDDRSNRPDTPDLPGPDDLVRVADDEPASGSGGEASGSGSGGGSGSGSGSGSGGSGSGSTPPEESDPDPDPDPRPDPEPEPDPDPPPPPPPPVQTVDTVAGTLQVVCELDGTISLVSDGGLLGGHSASKAGPNEIVVVGLLGLNVVTVSCNSSGSPSVSLL